MSPRAYRDSGLTRAALRGADYRPADSLGALAALTGDALGEADRTLVLAYHGDLDSTGHLYGVASPAWSNQLAHVDKLAEQIASSLPYGSVLYVTADHGMVDVGADDRIDADEDGSMLRDGVALLGGEARLRHVYAQPGAADDVLATWREVLGERAWVMSREEAVKDGWFASGRHRGERRDGRPHRRRGRGEHRQPGAWWRRRRSRSRPRSSACTAR